MKLLNIITIACWLLNPCVKAQEKLINIGPMVGYSQMRESILWIQTTQEAEVKFKYWEQENPNHSFWTETKTTQKADAYTAKFITDSVSPGTKYEYQVFINDHPASFDYATEFQTLPIWLFRGNPPPVYFALGSCAYINEKEFDRPGKPYGDEVTIFEQIHQKDPDFMLWLGDNIYFREADWNSWTGVVKRYTHDRAIPELQPLFASIHHYHVWDDHDFGPNNSNKSFWMKDETLKAFELFTANPSYGVDGVDGITTYFNWADCDFFLLDNRYHRDPNRLKTENKTILGQDQLQWLKEALVFSKANFKFVVMGGQFLNTAGNYETYTNYGFEGERQEIIDFIYEHQIRNVIFLDGDRHHTELSELKEEGKPRILDFTVSPLTSGPVRNVTENNILRVEGSLTEQRNFGTVNITGPLQEREIVFTTFDKDGTQLWKKKYLMED